MRLSSFLVLCLLAPSVARAAPPPAATTEDIAQPAPRFEASAGYRLIGAGLSAIPLDEQGTELGRKAWIEQRLRLMATFRPRRLRSLRVELGADLFSGQLAGDTSAVGARFLRQPRDGLDAHQGFEPRRAMVAWRSRHGELRAGHQASDWGYGILANSGERELDFGDQRLGDLVERLAFVTMPRPDLFVALGVDLVYRDSNAELLDGDVGINAVGSVFFRRQRTFLGFYSALREQWDDGGERLEVLALDLHGRHGGQLLDGQVDWEAGFEGVLLLGSTSRVRPEPDLDGAVVATGGAVARGGLTYRPWRIGLSFEAGLAAGDNDRNDDTVRHLTFHPDYRVGLILFDQALAGMTARSADRLADPSHVGQAPLGTRAVPTNGGVQNAFYLWPRIWFEPLERLVLRFGLLHARAVADLVDSYSTNLVGGGSNRGFYGGPGSARDLGLEIQLGARYRIALRHGFSLHLGLEWARLFHGGAVVDETGRSMLPDLDRVVGRVLVDWRYR